MAGAVLVILLILYVLGYIRIPGLTIPNWTLFTVAGRPITLFNILILLVIMWAIEILPSPLRQIVMILLLLWVLSELGFIVIAGLSHIVIIAIIVGIVLSLF